MDDVQPTADGCAIELIPVVELMNNERRLLRDPQGVTAIPVDMYGPRARTENG
jgi:hypothetical protein